MGWLFAKIDSAGARNGFMITGEGGGEEEWAGKGGGSGRESTRDDWWSLQRLGLMLV